MKRYGVIYRATNIVNGKCYIGLAKGSMKHRQTAHKNSAIKNIGKRMYFHNALKKYGLENFIWEEIDEAFSADDLKQKEKEWIWLCKSNDSQYGYNLTAGGDGLLDYRHTAEARRKMCGRPMSETTRMKLIERNTGKAKTNEVKKKISEKLKGRKIPRERVERSANARRGIPRKPETLKKMSEAQKGRKKTPEQRLKNSLAQKGKKASEETKEKMRQSMLGKNRIPCSAEKKKKISETLKGRKVPLEQLANRPSRKGSRKMIKDGVTKQVQKEFIEQYLNENWKFKY